MAKAPMFRPQKKGCANCPYWGEKIKARGALDAPLVIVGEAPGTQELREGVPFVGPSGEVLWDCIPGGEEALEKDVFLTNAMFCFPGNRATKDPAKQMQAMHCCRDRLMEEIKAHPRKIILTLGNYAMWSVTGDHSLRIMSARGGLLKSPLASHGVIPALHPAALLSGTGNFRQFKEDVEYAYDLSQGGPLKKHVIPNVIRVDTSDKLDRMLKLFRARLDREGEIELGSDIETTGFDFKYDRILCLGFTYNPRTVFVFPEEQLVEYYEELQAIFQDERIKLTWHNGKFDTKFLRNYGFDARVDDDTMLMNYSLDETRGIHDLEQVGKDLLGAPDYKFMVTPYVKGKKGATYENVPRHILYKYMAIDCSLTLQISRVLKRRLALDKRDVKLYTRTLMPMSDFLTKVEERGIPVDPDRLDENQDMYFGNEEKGIEGLIPPARQKLVDIAGFEFNPNSSQQVSPIIYDHFGLKLPPKYRNERGTGKELLRLLPRHPFVVALEDYRKIQKAYTTYVKPFFQHRKADGRVHTTFLIHGTPTGRLASRNPNVQNIPRLSQLRGMFMATAGRIFVEVDLNQAELRSLAALSGDPELCRIYTEAGLSLHKEVATALFGPNYDKEQYMRAKAVNFGIVYGREAASLAEELKIPVYEGQRMIDGWAKRFPVAWAYIQRCRRTPARLENIITTFGRKKRHKLVSREMLHAMQNEAANMPHQSIASDINTHNAMECDDILVNDLDSYIINLVHDSILIDCPFDVGIVRQVIELLEDNAVKIPPKWGITRVPFKADSKVGKRWGEGDEITRDEVEGYMAKLAA